MRGCGLITDSQQLQQARCFHCNNSRTRGRRSSRCLQSVIIVVADRQQRHGTGQTCPTRWMLRVPAGANQLTPSRRRCVGLASTTDQCRWSIITPSARSTTAKLAGQQWKQCAPPLQRLTFIVHRRSTSDQHAQDTQTEHYMQIQWMLTVQPASRSATSYLHSVADDRSSLLSACHSSLHCPFNRYSQCVLSTDYAVSAASVASASITVLSAAHVHCRPTTQYNRPLARLTTAASYQRLTSIKDKA